MNGVNGVPPAEVGRVVQDFIDNGAEQVIVEREPDGAYTVSAR